MGRKVAQLDRFIGEIAKRQHGVVSIAQLRRVGAGATAVRGRVRAGRLHRVHRGVYAVGHLGLASEGRWMAAVLALAHPLDGYSGSVLSYWGAALGHRSAAVCWGLLPARAGPIDVIVPGNNGRVSRRGIRVHRSVTLASTEVTLRNRIPITDPARTIADLRRASSASPAPGSVSSRELGQAIRQADVLGVSTGPDDLSDRTRSELERRFLSLCRDCDLPAPEVNAVVGSHEVDFLWRPQKLIVETDGYRFHRGRLAFERDRVRDLELRGRGFEVVRLSHAQVFEDPSRVVSVLGAILR